MIVNHKKSKMEGGRKKILLQGYKNWLKTLGYSESTVYSFPLQLVEYLEFLETKKALINEKTALEFMAYFKGRKNKRRSGGLSISHVNKQIDVLNKFFIYLEKTNRIKCIIKLRRLEEKEMSKRIVLTNKEIKSLYAATGNNIFGLRDRAMLSIYYGCGLRKKEGLELELDDILLGRKLIYVRHPKNGYERYVPMNKKCKNDIENYIYNARPILLPNGSETNYLLISERGKRLSGSSAISRLNKLKIKASIHKNFGLHALRHSIATHLLEQGMSLENIALFLGHRDLNSTQIYTHLKNEKYGTD